ncbi:hypothetical protein BKA69DRAFT_1051647 [Paraphysoderma sedebokerense]|nr:hypothetical protein BKA69DRAFT_1051647 [Paraphysoderma sedebokerense]
MYLSARITCFLLISLLSVSLATAAVSYSGEQVIRVDVNNENRQKIHQLAQEINADVWTHSSNGPIDMRVSSSELKSFQDNNIHYDVTIENLNEYVSTSCSPKFLSNSSEGDVNATAETFSKSYPNGEQITSFLDNTMSANKGIMRSQVIGKSVEGKPLTVYTITSNSTTTTQKKGFFIIGGQHAREWISPATVIYMMNEFVTKYGQQKNITNVLDYFEFHFLPMMNPDGYAYTINGERLWRKNRQVIAGSKCEGIDLNRNWPYQWEDPANEGSSNDSCSDTFRGTKAMEAPEVESVVKYIQQNGKREGYWQGSIDFHAFSQLWMFPNAAECKSKAPDHDILLKAATHATDALFRATQAPEGGTKFVPGSTCNVIGYKSTGSSMDWAYYVQKIMFSFAVELRDQGAHQFALPPDQIVSSGVETFEGLLGLAEFIIDFYRKGGKSGNL